MAKENPKTGKGVQKRAVNNQKENNE